MAQNHNKSAPSIITSTYMQQNFGEVMRRAVNNRESFIVQRGGLSVFVILPVANYDTLTKNSGNAVGDLPR